MSPKQTSDDLDLLLVILGTGQKVKQIPSILHKENQTKELQFISRTTSSITSHTNWS
jgi:hypothetical protein